MMRKCNVCRAEFQPTRPLQSVCGHDCAVSLATSKREKEWRSAKVNERKEDKAKRDKLKSKAQWAREAQAAFNAFIRARDADLPCISCGRHHAGQYHAGHYLSVGARPELRYIEINVHKQCAPCNTHLSGNAVMYRAGLIRKVGKDVVEWLEGPHDPKKYTIADLRFIKKIYTEKLKKMKESQS